MKLERAVGKIVKLESFMLERTFQLDDFQCINENLERTFQLKAFQLHNLSNSPFQLHVGRFRGFVMIT